MRFVTLFEFCDKFMRKSRFYFESLSKLAHVKFFFQRCAFFLVQKEDGLSERLCELHSSVKCVCCTINSQNSNTIRRCHRKGTGPGRLSCLVWPLQGTRPLTIHHCHPCLILIACSLYCKETKYLVHQRENLLHLVLRILITHAVLLADH